VDDTIAIALEIVAVGVRLFMEPSPTRVLDVNGVGRERRHTKSLKEEQGSKKD
jgi:hypothetical protein